ncbi:MAG: tyrosine-type recombinase/integrase [Deltaproteobacteria bacterium]|nr:tyrosine-type recombinase/integrase [Deltaproteobacteria bacterium]
MGVFRPTDSKTKKKAPFWWISYSVGGRRFRESSGSTRKADAEALLAKRKVELFEGRHFPDKKKADLTVAELSSLWLDHAANKKSLEADKLRFPAIVEILGEHTRIASLEPAHIEALKRQLANRAKQRGQPDDGPEIKLGPATINRHIALLKSALKLAARDGYLHRDPMRGVKMLREPDSRDRIATVDEYGRLIEAANPKLRLAIVIAYHSAMRRGEIAQLRWEYIDLKASMVRLPATITKTSEGRLVPLSAEAVNELRSWPRNLYGSVFGTTSANISRRFASLTKKLGIEGLRFHDLRHTTATNLRRANVDVFTIAKITGHKSLATLKRYQTISADDLRAAMDRVAGVKK